MALGEIVACAGLFLFPLPLFSASKLIGQAEEATAISCSSLLEAAWVESKLLLTNSAAMEKTKGKSNAEVLGI